VLCSWRLVTYRCRRRWGNGRWCRCVCIHCGVTWWDYAKWVNFRIVWLWYIWRQNKRVKKILKNFPPL
jgi:hypothetical protein